MDEDFEPPQEHLLAVANLMCREVERGRRACYQYRDCARRLIVNSHRQGGYILL